MRPKTRATPNGVAIAVAGLTVLGLLLRLACAHGDLWLDEIWSLRNLQHLKNAGDILWRLPNDNNHLLNSLWLWLVGPAAPTVLARLESIAVGTLTIPVAAKFCGRSGPAAALTGAGLAAGGAIFVQYGSEARGYAGLLLMIFVAAEALENILEDSTPRTRLAFAGAVALGALFHLTMLAAAATLIAAAVLRLAYRGRPPREILIAGLDLALLGFLGALPALGLLAASVLNAHLLQEGALTPFSLAALGHSLTTLYAATLGLPYDLALPLALLACAGLTLAAVVLIASERLILPLTCLLLPPLVATLVQAPNVQYARFFLVGVLGLVILASDVIARLWDARRLLGVFLLVFLMALGNCIHVGELFVFGRGNIRPLVARMESHGPARFATNMPVEVWVSLNFYDPRGMLSEVQAQDWCSRPPDWFVLSDQPAAEASTATFGPPQCRTRYALDMVIPRAPLSGLRFALYRRAIP
ncbi:hypothetical protein [Methylovirgula ligni]|nr:hypothetical protein [Methylovirgula ligni]